MTVVAILAFLGLGTGCAPADELSPPGVEVVQRTTHPAFLHGRVVTTDGETYRGRLRFGGDEEAFWGDYFNGRKDVNPWIAHMPAGERPRRGIRFIGLRIGGDAAAAHRPFMARMGDIAKLEARGRDLWVTMKSGTVHHLNRYAADDFADGVRVWDATRGVVDLHERGIRTIEFEAPPQPGSEAPYRLHGSVRAGNRVFTGFIQWGPEGSLAMDPLHGLTGDGERVNVPFATVRAISRLSSESAMVTLLDGRELVLSDSRHIGEGNRRIYVDDARYGRVLVSWDALERADFTPVGAAGDYSGPAYGDFPAGRPLVGTVTARDGRKHIGRIVFDLDESEVTETLDAPLQGVDYTLPFELVESIVPRDGNDAGSLIDVLLRSGERIQLERAGDLGNSNGGVLIFAGGDEQAAYVSWDDVARIDLAPGR